MTDSPSAFVAKGNGHVNGAGARRAEASIATGDLLDVRRFHVSARVSGLFEARIVAVSDNPDIDFEGAIGQPARLALSARGERSLAGICSHLQQIAVEEKHLSTYEVTLVPTLWLATQRRNHRMFQQMSEIDIVKKILGEWGIAFSLKLGGSYKKRKIRVQYGESDYDFVSRMLEDAGVSFTFDEGGTMVLDDGPQQNGARAPIPFRDHPLDTDQEHVTEVHVGRRLRPGKYTMRDHDHRRPPAFPLMQSASSGGVEARLERFHYAPGAFLFESDRGDPTPVADDKGRYRTDDAEAKKIAERRLDAKRGSAREVSFFTNVLDPAPGTVLSFLDHPKSELGAGKRLLVTESKLTGEIPGVWRHQCVAVSAETPYRPPLRAKKPRVAGVESATVVGPPGEEIHVDELGRVRVHFHWDRESKMNDQSSCWIHVSQPWGGAGYGGSNLPRVGQEVIVDFLNGDPDRPVIIGRVYTGLQKTPYKLPESKTQSGLKSNSTGGGGGYNELMFEDAAGRELLRLQAERDLTKLVKNDESVTIGNDRSKEVGRDDSHQVGRDRAHRVGRDELMKIAQDRMKNVGRDESVAVARDQSFDVGNDKTVTIGRDKSETVGNDRTRRVGQNEDVTIGKDLTKNVADNERETTGQNRTITVGQNRTSDVGQVDSTEVGEKFFVKVKQPEGQVDEKGAQGAGDEKGAKGAKEEKSDEPTTLTMIDKKIVLTTGGGATITMEGSTVRIEADLIELLAKKNIKANAESERVTVHAKKDVRLSSDKTIHAWTEGGNIEVRAKGALDLHADDGDVHVSSSKRTVISAETDAFVMASSGKFAAVGKTAAELTSENDTTVTGRKTGVGGETTAVVGNTVMVEAVHGAVTIQGGPWVKINP